MLVVPHSQLQSLISNDLDYYCSINNSAEQQDDPDDLSDDDDIDNQFSERCCNFLSLHWVKERVLMMTLDTFYERKVIPLLIKFDASTSSSTSLLDSIKSFRRTCRNNINDDDHTITTRSRRILNRSTAKHLENMLQLCVELNNILTLLTTKSSLHVRSSGWNLKDLLCLRRHAMRVKRIIVECIELIRSARHDDDVTMLMQRLQSGDVNKDNGSCSYRHLQDQLRQAVVDLIHPSALQMYSNDVLDNIQRSLTENIQAIQVLSLKFHDEEPHTEEGVIICSIETYILDLASQLSSMKEAVVLVGDNNNTATTPEENAKRRSILNMIEHSIDQISSCLNKFHGQTISEQAKDEKVSMKDVKSSYLVEDIKTHSAFIDYRANNKEQTLQKKRNTSPLDNLDEPLKLNDLDEFKEITNRLEKIMSEGFY